MSRAAGTNDIRKALVSQLEAELPNVLVKGRLVASVVTPAVVVQKKPHGEKQYMGQAVPWPRWDLVAMLDLADESRIDEMDDLTDAIRAALHADETLGGVVGSLRVVEIGEERIMQMVDQRVYGCPVTVEVVA